MSGIRLHVHTKSQYYNISTTNIWNVHLEIELANQSCKDNQLSVLPL